MIRNWVKHEAVNAGEPSGKTTAEQQELWGLSREDRQLKLERAKAGGNPAKGRTARATEA